MAMANSVDCQLKRLRMLSLEDISLRRVATTLLRDPLKYRYETTVEYERGEKRVVSREEQFQSLVAKLELPESISEPLVNIMHPIFLETSDWLTFHELFLYQYHSEFCSLKYTKHIHWTHMGTINYRKTAEAMIRDKNLKIEWRFMFACLYCLEKDIQDIWEEMSLESKREIYKNDRCGQPREIIVLWIWLLERRIDKLDSILNLADRRHSSINQYAFETFVDHGYETATQYFFEKLTCEEKDASLVRTAKAVAANAVISYGPCPKICCYLLSQMNAEQLQNFLENSSNGILKLFLEWPRHYALPEIAKLLFPYFKAIDYNSMHLYLLLKFKHAYNATELFQHLFVVIPKQYRHSAFYMNGLLQGKYTETIRFMFKNMDSAETLELAFSDITLFSCHMLVEEGEWDFLEFFIHELRLSKEDRDRFVSKFNLHVESPYVLDKHERERFTKMMNDIPAEASDRDFSNCNKINQTDSMDSQPTVQPDGELIERPAKKKNKKLLHQIILNHQIFFARVYKGMGNY